MFAVITVFQFVQRFLVTLMQLLEIANFSYPFTLNVLVERSPVGNFRKQSEKSTGWSKKLILQVIFIIQSNTVMTFTGTLSGKFAMK